MDVKDYLSSTEAAEAMQKHRSQVQALCRQGKLEGAIKRGRDWLIPRASAENYTPGPRGFAAHPENIKNAPAIQPEWQDVLSPRPPKKNGS